MPYLPVESFWQVGCVHNAPSRLTPPWHARYPVLRLLGVAACLAAFGSAAAFTGYPYGLTPLGGALAGCLPALLLLPHVKSEKYEWFLPYLAGASTLAFCVLLPAVLYGDSLQRLSCPAL